MNSIRSFRLVTAALLVSLVTLLPGCAYDVYGPGPSAVQHPAYYYDYNYYPGAGVYFNIYSGYYYYRSNNVWMRARVLPSSIYLGPHVGLRIWSDRPYTYYNAHRERYHPARSYHPSAARNRTERRNNYDRHEQYLKRYRH